MPNKVRNNSKNTINNENNNSDDVDEKIHKKATNNEVDNKKDKKIDDYTREEIKKIIKKLKNLISSDHEANEVNDGEDDTITREEITGESDVDVSDDNNDSDNNNAEVSQKRKPKIKKSEKYKDEQNEIFKKLKKIIKLENNTYTSMTLKENKTDLISLNKEIKKYFPCAVWQSLNQDSDKFASTIVKRVFEYYGNKIVLREHRKTVDGKPFRWYNYHVF